MFNVDFICCVFVYQLVLTCPGYDLKLPTPSVGANDLCCWSTVKQPITLRQSTTFRVLTFIFTKWSYLKSFCNPTFRTFSIQNEVISSSINRLSFYVIFLLFLLFFQSGCRTGFIIDPHSVNRKKVTCPTCHESMCQQCKKVVCIFRNSLKNNFCNRIQCHCVRKSVTQLTAASSVANRVKLTLRTSVFWAKLHRNLMRVSHEVLIGYVIDQLLFI